MDGSSHRQAHIFYMCAVLIANMEAFTFFNSMTIANVCFSIRQVNRMWSMVFMLTLQLVTPATILVKVFIWPYKKKGLTTDIRQSSYIIWCTDFARFRVNGY